MKRILTISGNWRSERDAEWAGDAIDGVTMADLPQAVLDRIEALDERWAETGEEPDPEEIEVEGGRGGEEWAVRYTIAPARG